MAAQRKKTKVPGVYRRGDGKGYDWYVYTTGVSGKRTQQWHSKVPTRVEARDQRAAAIADEAAGRYVADRRMTMAQYVERMFIPDLERRFRRGTLEANTLEGYRRQLRTHIVPQNRLGGHPLVSISKRTIEEFYEMLEREGRRAEELQTQPAKYPPALYEFCRTARAQGQTMKAIGAEVARRWPEVGEISRYRINRVIDRAEAVSRPKPPVMPRGLSIKTITHLHHLLCQLFDAAMREDPPLVQYNPARRADAPQEPRRARKPKVAWTPDQVGAFLAFARAKDDRLYPVYMVAATSADRRSAILGLRWDDINWEGMDATVTWAVVDPGHTVMVKPWLKTSAGHTMPIDSVTVAVLRTWRERQRGEMASAGSIHTCDDLPAVDDWPNTALRPTCNKPGYHDRGLVFPRADGDFMDPETVSRLFRRRQQQYNRQHPDAPLPLVGLHALRHSWAELARWLQVDIATIADQLDHADRGRRTTTLYTGRALTPGRRLAAEMVAGLVTEAAGLRV